MNGRAYTLVILAAAIGSLLAAVPATALLPDGRQYELVSPPDKRGGDVLVTSWRTRIAADGSAFAFASLTGFANPGGVAVASDYISVRSSKKEPETSGWATHGLTPPQKAASIGGLLSGNEPLYVGDYSADLNAGVFYASTPVTNDLAVGGVPNLYLRSNLRTPGPGSYALLTACPACDVAHTPLPPFPPLPSVALRWRPVLAGSSPDRGRVIFESRQTLTAETAPQPAECQPAHRVFSRFCRTHLYEWNAGTVRLAGILPDGSPADVSIAGRGAGSNTDPSLTPGVISDGSDGHDRVFFTQPTDGDGHSSSEVAPDFQVEINFTTRGKVFMRVDDAVTTQLNSSERSSPDVFAPAAFLDASADGSRAFFMTQQALTDDAQPDGQQKIYLYEAAARADGHHLALVSQDAPGGQLLGDAVGVIGISDNGHFVYFIADSGGRSIYVWHDGVVRRVGPAPAGANVDELLHVGVVWSLAPWQAGVTPDGRHLVFSAYNGEGLTGYDHSFCPEGGTCRELYVFSADTGGVVCASCNPTGVPATGDATIVFGRDTIGGTRVDPTPGRAITADGSRVFFTSPEALVSDDTNNRRDAYQYDVETRTLALLSSGKSTADSYFLGVTSSGADAFILTREQLVGWDIDDAYDVYDTRKGGGFPEPVGAKAPCEGDDCLGASQGLIGAFASRGSATFVSGGNNQARAHRKVRHCRRGRVRKVVRGRSRCVKARGKVRKRRPRAGAVRGGRS